MRELIERIPLPDENAREAARRAFDAKTKPRGSLGRLEDVAAQIAAVSGTASPRSPEPVIVVVAADHGVATHGVSAYPQEVTAQMVANFVAGGAAVSVLARDQRTPLVVVDAGIVAPCRTPGVRSLRFGAGTRDITLGPAMLPRVAAAAVDAGAQLAAELVQAGAGLVAVGEMGIGNSTAASAVCARLLPASPADVCGRGTGLDDAGLERKVAIVERALAANAVDAADPLGVLAALGGFELAVLTGVMLGCAAERVPVVLDGFITGAAALVAARLAPPAAAAMIAAHLSPEPGHRLTLAALGLEPLVDLSLRLGEGSGAALVLPLVRSAVSLLAEMATYTTAGVTDTRR
jgi:nicotinate-nucleotide--dimethylbenzimidazole phosphoribosyltransferase